MTGESAWRSLQAKTSTAAAVEASATAPPASGLGLLHRPLEQQRARQVGGEHRRHQVRAAALVLLLRVARVVVVGLVGGDRLVLDAVVGGQLAAAQREQRRARARSARTPARRRRPARGGLQQRARERRAGGDADHARVLEGQLGLRQPPLDQRDAPRTPRRAARARAGRGRRRAAVTRGLGPERDLDEPSLARTAAAQCVGPWTSSPLRRAIPPRRSLSSGTGISRSLPGRSWKKAAAKPRSRTSMRSSLACISGQVS